MTATKTRREKVAAMAAQSASPEEAKVAANLLATMEKPRLEAIADEVRSEWGKGIESQFAIGRLLGEARATFPADQEFGQWLRASKFPFSYQTAWNLRIGAEREQEVRDFIALNAGGEQPRELGVTTAIRELTAKPKPGNGEVEPTTDTTPVHRAYDAIRTAHRLLVTEHGFEDMHVDDMAKVAGFITDIVEAYKAERAQR